MATAQQVEPDVSAVVGQTIDGRYRVDGVLTRGGMSTILHGHHLTLNREIALKVIDPSLAIEHRRRFVAEAENAARLDHPNCIHVYDYGTTQSGLQYMVMPLLRGVSLHEQLGDDPMPPQQVIDLGLQILRGLEHAHRQGIVHRDLKPENLFMTEDADGSSTLKIVDFGIAKIQAAPSTNPANATMSGLMSGTPGYMSPEQALGLETDPRSDLYSVGLILYRLLTGTLPFEGPDAVAVLQRKLTETVPALPDSVPAPLAAVVDGLVQRRRDDRPATATAALQALEEAASRLDDDHDHASWSAEQTDPLTEQEIQSLGSKRKAVATTLLLAAAAAAVAVIVGRPASGEPQTEQAAPPSMLASAAKPHLQPQAAAVAPTPDPAAMLAAVNDPRPEHVLPFDERHEVLAHLRAIGRGEEIDERLNLAFDLMQAGESSSPCTTFRAALEEIERRNDPYFAPFLVEAKPPQGDDPACDGSERMGAAEREGLDRRGASRAKTSPRKRSKRSASAARPPGPPTKARASAGPAKTPTKPAETSRPSDGSVTKLETGLRPLF